MGKKVIVFYRPDSVTREVPDPIKLEGAKTGYAIHHEDGVAIGYRLWADERTVLVPTGVVQRIEQIP